MRAFIIPVFILVLILIPEVVFALPIITLEMSTQNYSIGQTVVVRGFVNLSSNDPQGLPVSIELYDPNRSVIDAQTISLTNNQFTYTIPTGYGSNITGNGKFTVIAYYGNPNPMLLNKTQSSRVSFVITGASSNQGGLDHTNQTSINGNAIVPEFGPAVGVVTTLSIMGMLIIYKRRRLNV